MPGLARFRANVFADRKGRGAVFRVIPAKILTALTQSPIYYQFAAGFVMLVPSLVVIFFIRRYLLGLWGRVVK